MTLRLRTEAAWALRGIARWLDRRAERMEPIKISADWQRVPLTSAQVYFDGPHSIGSAPFEVEFSISPDLASSSMAQRAIDKAKG